MKRRNAGLIVNLSTILAHVNLPLMGSYCASKAALHSLTQGVRAELAPWGVRVMGVYAWFSIRIVRPRKTMSPLRSLSPLGKSIDRILQSRSSILPRKSGCRREPAS